MSDNARCRALAKNSESELGTGKNAMVLSLDDVNVIFHGTVIIT